jgi:hypothetical protein
MAKEKIIIDSDVCQLSSIAIRYAAHSDPDTHTRIPNQDLHKREASAQSLLQSPQNRLESNYSHFYAHMAEQES